MKKLLFILATLTLSAQAAHAYMCQVDLVDNRGRVVDSFRAQTDMNGACRDGLRDCNREMRVRGIQGQCVTRNNPAPNPNPYPNPNPNPYPNPNPNPYPGNYGMTVTAIVENTLVVLQGYSNGDIFNQCMQRVPNTAVDEITMVTNNSAVRRLVNSSSYWNRAADTCTVIMNNISNEASYNTMIDVYGTLENRPLSIRASSKADALSQCYSQSANIGQIDDMSISVNNSPLRVLRNQSSYWKNAGQVCLVVMQQIDQIVR
jgi:hypothetical protein